MRIFATLLLFACTLSLSSAQTPGGKSPITEITDKWNCGDITSIKKKYKENPAALKGAVKWKSEEDQTVNYVCKVKFPGAIYADAEGYPDRDLMFARQFYAWEVSESEAVKRYQLLKAKLSECYTPDKDSERTWETKYNLPDGTAIFLENLSDKTAAGTYVYSVCVRINFLP